MVKKLICLSLVGLGTITAIAGVDAGSLSSAIRKANGTGVPSTTAAAQQAKTDGAATQSADQLTVLSGFVKQQARGENLRIETPVLESRLQEAPLTAERADFGCAQPLSFRAGLRVPAISPGTIIAKETNYKGALFSATMSYSEVPEDEDGNPLKDTYALYNIYNTGSTILFTIDSTTGEVTIPSQVVLNHSTYGEVKVCPVTQTATGFSYSLDPIKGMMDDKGVITLNPWGIIVTDENSGYKNAAFNFMVDTKWAPANAIVKAYDFSKAADKEYEILMEQTAPDAARFYCLSGVTSEILDARLTTSKTVVISPQKVYTNAMYGDFYMYPASITDDNKLRVDSKSYIVATPTDKGLTIPAWAIAAKASPSQYVGYAYSNIEIIPDVALTFPERIAASWQGAGTAADPYKISNLTELQALSQAVEAGETMKDKHFLLTASLTPSTLQPIGDQATPWQGHFDGGNNTISGMTLDNAGFANTGIFGWIDTVGVVENLNIDKCAFKSVGANMGSIAGFSDGTIRNCHVTSTTLVSAGDIVGGIVGGSRGTISNCSFTGAVSAYGSGGGIAGQAFGNISDCWARANISLDGYIGSTARDIAGIAGVFFRGKMQNCWMSGVLQDNYGMGVVGGVVGRMSSAEMYNCYSVAAIQAKRISSQDDNYTGGIVAYSSDAIVHDCFFGGTILKSEASERVGGIIGYLAVGYSSTGTKTSMINKTDVRRCYSSAAIITPSANTKKGIYGETFLSTSWTGEHPEDLCFFDCYFDQQVNDFSNDRWGRNTAFLTSGNIETFNTDTWQQKAGEYPLLKQFADNPSARLAAVPILLQDGQNAKKVKEYFEWTLDPQVEWSISSDAVTVSGNRATVGSDYASVAVSAIASDNWALKLYRLALVPSLFNGKGTQDDPYKIATAADWERLNQGVSEFQQEHQGDYFVMTNDIDLSASTFMGLGYGYGANRKFGGCFDGQNHVITGLTIDPVVMSNATTCDNLKSIPYTGLFGVTTNTAEIRNLVMGADNSLRSYTYGGAVAAVNNGVMENVTNHAAINAFSSTNGGIVGLNNGVIRNCYNDGRINSCSFNAAGIAGYNNPTGVIEGCQNDADIVGASIDGINANTAYNTFAGITAYNYGKIANCLNAGQVTAANTVGGITGVTNGAYQTGDVTGCINTGLITATQVCTTRGGLIGELRNEAPIANNYYDSSININGGVNNNEAAGCTGLSTAELTSGEALKDLTGIDYKAGLYPVLAAYANNASAKALRSMYIGFQPKMKRTNVQETLTLSKAENLTWELAEGSNAFAIADGKLTVSIPENAVGHGTLTATFAPYSKTYDLSAIPTILKGEGTAEDPYLIESPADWNKLARFVETSTWEYPGNHFAITNDLDFAGDSICVIAVSGTNFQGTLDGRGHTIKGYVYKNINSVKTRLAGPNCYVGKNIGLLGTLGSQGKVCNLTAEGTYHAYGLLGGIVGDNYGVIDNVISRVNITNESAGSIGGIAYKSWEGSTISNCTFEGKIVTKTLQACGIACVLNKSAVIENCVNKGEIAPTTTQACGIVYTCNGSLKNCENRGVLKGTGTAIGIAYTLGANASMENCHNYSDLDFVTGLAKAGTGICGLFYTTTTRKVTDTDFSGGYIINCTNYGNLTGGDGVYGVGNAVKHGWYLQDVHNKGNLSSTGIACGMANTIGEFSGPTEDQLKDSIPNAWTRVDNCSNSGEIVANKAGIAGLASQVYNFTRLTNCCNLGNITNANTGLTTGGITAKNSGQLINCYNAGDINSAGNAVGGIAGYLSDGKPGARAMISHCFNLGNVISNYTGTNTNGTCGGLVGYFACTAATTEESGLTEYSYNAGAVIAPQRVGGLSAGAFRPFNPVHHCYNSGRVICLKPDSEGRYYWSGTTFTNSYTYKVNGEDVFMLSAHSDCYYDATVNAGGQFRNVPNSAKTTEEMAALNLGDEFVTLGHGGYPVLKNFADHDASSAASAMLVLYNAQHDHSGIGDPVTLIAPEGSVWTAYTEGQDESSDITATAYVPTSTIYFEDGFMKFTEKVENALIKCTTPDGHSRSFVVTVDPAMSQVKDLDADKPVDHTEYFDMQGRRVINVQPGQVYIQRTVYTDGTSRAAKVATR